MAPRSYWAESDMNRRALASTLRMPAGSMSAYQAHATSSERPRTSSMNGGGTSENSLYDGISDYGAASSYPTSPARRSSFARTEGATTYQNTPSSSQIPSLNHGRSFSRTTAQYDTSQHQMLQGPGPTPPRRQGWREWAGDKINKAKARGIGLGVSAMMGAGEYGTRAVGYGASSSDTLSSTSSDVTEVITLFPGWAAKRYANQSPQEALSDPTAPIPFEVETVVSGYVISYRNRDNMSRAHRAFVRLAKGFASLPKLVSDATTPPNSGQSTHHTNPRTSRSTEDLLAQTGPIHLPPRPDEMDAAYDIAYREEGDEYSRLSEATQTPRGALDSSGVNQQPSSDPSPGEALVNITSDAIQKLHANLEERLKPFWSSVVANRTVRLHIFASPHYSDGSHPNLDNIDDESYWQYNKPLGTTEVLTTADGSFQARFVIPWDELCHHPRGLHIAFGSQDKEHDVIVVAEFPNQLLQQDSTDAAIPVPYASYTSSRRASNPTPPSSASSTSSKITTRTQIHIPITHSPIRVISDIDDTVKKSGILNGARSVFYNVFAKELEDCVVPGMGAWYSEMFTKGVRFHYVSNGPFEYIGVFNEFLPLSQLPPGSVKLKSYARRSLFNGLMTTAAGRKRAGVEEVLDSFPDSRFFLIGDSGEQDLELYTDLARERPSNILGVFIRDVSTVEGVTDPIDDPTGWNAVVAHATAGTMGLDSQANLAEDADSETFGDLESRRPSLVSGGARRSVSDLLLRAGKKSGSLPSFLSPKEREQETPTSDTDRRTGQSAYFDVSPGPSRTGVLNSEPESMEMGEAIVGTDSTPRVDPGPRMTPIIYAGSTLKSAPTNGEHFINEAPKPTPPPSLHRRSSSSPTMTNPAAVLADVASRRSQRTGDTASSLSSASSSLGSRFSSAVSLSGSTSGGTNRLSDSESASLREMFRAKVSRVSRVASSASMNEERRRAELQLRVWKARTVMPSHVVLRLFRHPEECTEVNVILGKELGKGDKIQDRI